MLSLKWQSTLNCPYNDSLCFLSYCCSLSLSLCWMSHPQRTSHTHTKVCVCGKLFPQCSAHMFLFAQGGPARGPPPFSSEGSGGPTGVAATTAKSAPTPGVRKPPE